MMHNARDINFYLTGHSGNHINSNKTYGVRDAQLNNLGGNECSTSYPAQFSLSESIPVHTGQEAGCTTEPSECCGVKFPTQEMELWLPSSWSSTTVTELSRHVY